MSLLALLAVSIAAAPAEPACLLGRALDPAGRPVLGALITLVGRSDPVAIGPLATGADGGFEFRGLAPGRFWLIAERLGFEPDFRSLDIDAPRAIAADVHLSPLVRILRDPSSRAELPWILRARGLDPLREAQPGLVELSAGPVPQLERPLAGRVGFTALAGELHGPSSRLLDTVGGRAQLALEGELNRSVDWHLDGQLDELGVAQDGAGGEAQAQRLSYGLGYERGESSLRFEGKLRRATRDPADPAASAALAESRESYALSYRSGGPSEDSLDLQVGYRSAVADGPLAGADAAGRHRILEGQGAYSVQLDRRNRFLSRLRLRAQRWSEPNAGLLADAARSQDTVLDQRWFAARDWDIELEGAHEWRPSTRLRVLPGIELARGEGESGIPLLRPRLGASLELGLGTRVLADLSWTSVPGPQSAAGALGVEIGFEQEVGAGGRLRVSALRNGQSRRGGLERESFGRGDYVLFARGALQSQEVRIDLRTPDLGGVRGFVALVVGEAEGRLALVPLLWTDPGGTLLPLEEGSVRYASATLGGTVAATETDVLVRYRSLDGLPSAGDYARVDLELAQVIPWWDPLGARLDLLVGVSEYLRRPASAREGEGLLFEAQPALTAGVGVRF